LSKQKQAPAEEKKPILELSNVTSAVGDAKSIRLRKFTWRLFEGDVVRVKLEGHHDPRDLLSLILGLCSPVSGNIHFTGRSWLGENYRQHYQMRGQIGRVFAGAAWIQSLTVGENILLAQLHHGIKKNIIADRIEKWTRRLSGRHIATVQRSFTQRPNFVDEPILQICQLIRAVCNQPKLLLLDRPLRFLMHELRQDFISVIDELTSNGACVLWFSSGIEELELKLGSRLTQWTMNADVLESSEVRLNHE
jgi:ABC-type sugar transport system ATPase subunit